MPLLGIPVSRRSLASALEECADAIRARRGGYVCFVNVHTLTESTVDGDLHKALCNAMRCYADGMPLVWLSKLKRSAIEGRVAGPDFMDAVLRSTTIQTHGFIGGAPGTAEQIIQRYRVRGVAHSPPMRAFSEERAVEDWNAFLARCDGQPPPVVWVGLGAPKQERWIAAVSKLAPGVMFFGVGAAFDFLGGNRGRAPLIMQQLGLEWTHRLATDPKRLWKRYLVSNSRFLALAFVELTTHLGLPED